MMDLFLGLCLKNGGIYRAVAHLWKRRAMTLLFANPCFLKFPLEIGSHSIVGWDLTLSSDLREERGEDAASLLSKQWHPHRTPADRLAHLVPLLPLLVAGDLRYVPPVLGHHPLAQHRLVLVSQRLWPLSRRLWTWHDVGGFGGLVKEALLHISRSK